MATAHKTGVIRQHGLGRIDYYADSQQVYTTQKKCREHASHTPDNIEHKKKSLSVQRNLGSTNDDFLLCIERSSKQIGVATIGYF